MFEIIVLHVAPELTQNEFDALLPIVSPEKRARVKKFRFFRDAQNCLLADVLARMEICRTTNFTNEQLRFSANAYGKPYLANSPGIHFNVSHTGNYVACAVSDEPVGIDIEQMRSTDLKVAERFFTPDERTYISANTPTVSFYEVWTTKESRIKWEGRGLSKLLSSFSVFDPEADKQKQPIYHKIFQNNEVICHICSTKQAAPSVKIMDTAAFMYAAAKII